MITPALTVAGLALLGVVAHRSRSSVAVVPFAIALVLAPSFPSIAAKKAGKFAMLSVSLSVFLALAAATWFGELVLQAPLPVRMQFGVLGATVGLVEGLLERSLLIAWCGLLGGGVAGGLMGSLIFPDNVIHGFEELLFGMTTGFVGAEVGVSLGLALGRRLRDRAGGEPRNMGASGKSD